MTAPPCQIALMAPADDQDPRAALIAAARADREAKVEAAQQDDGLVWHYTDGAGLISILRTHTLWATSSSFLNDQYEVALGLQLVAERVRQLAADEGGELFSTIADHLDDVTVEAFSELSPARFFILSASQSWDSLAMWRSYGGGRESYAVGLDASAPLSVLVDGPVPAADHPATGFMVKRQTWRPVAYTPQAQRTLVDAVLDEMPDQISAAQRSFIEQDEPHSISDQSARIPSEALELLDELEQALLLVKHQGFADERETRCSVVVWEVGDPAEQVLPTGTVAFAPVPMASRPTCG